MHKRRGFLHSMLYLKNFQNGGTQRLSGIGEEQLQASPVGSLGANLGSAMVYLSRKQSEQI